MPRALLQLGTTCLRKYPERLVVVAWFPCALIAYLGSVRALVKGKSVSRCGVVNVARVRICIASIGPGSSARSRCVSTIGAKVRSLERVDGAGVS